MGALVSVIITTKNEEKYLERTLRAIKKQSYRNIEIIVSDACSSDRTVEIARRYANKVLIKKTNIPEGKNLGARYAKGDILAFVDGDTKLPPDWVGEAVRALKDGVFVASILKPDSKQLKDRAICWIWSVLLPRFFLFIHHPHFPGAAIAVKTDCFKRIGGFDERLTVLEDADFSNRIAKIGKIKICRKLVAYTSMRRFKKGGYIRWLIKWPLYYFNYLLLSKTPKSHEVIR